MYKYQSLTTYSVTTSLLWVYDVTVRSADNPLETVRAAFSNVAKKWCFQEEEGEGGYRHYQCRLNLRVKARLDTIANKLRELGLGGFHCSRTSEGARKSFSYVQKEQSRIAGPWSDRQIRLPARLLVCESQPYQWQLQLTTILADCRRVHLVCDLPGGNGKSTWALYRHIQFQAIYITAWDEPIQVFQALYAATADQAPFSDYEIIIDLPRAPLADNKMHQLWTIVEGIKNGYIQEFRYQHKKAYLGDTKLIVFSNYPLKPGNNLSNDRAVYWHIVNHALHNVDPDDVTN